MVGLVVAVVLGLVLVVDGLLGGEVVLLADGVDDVVGDGPHCAKSAHAYASFRLRIYYWSITSLFFANSFLISARTACVLTGSLTMRLASLRQSRKINSTERFYINCAGFINKYNGWVTLRARLLPLPAAEVSAAKGSRTCAWLAAGARSPLSRFPLRH